MRTIALALMSLLLACSCATVNSSTKESSEISDMLDSTVQVEVDILATLILRDSQGRTAEIPVDQGWKGSGVVYSKSGGITGPVTSKILSANHVLDVPKVGSTKETMFGTLRVDAVLMSIRTRDGRACLLDPLVLGVTDTRDVATGIAYCDAGKVAPIARSVPPAGAKVYVVGHPLGIEMSIATEGYVSGWLDGYLLTSAPAVGGNSGGAVWYNGQVIGLLVRASGEYPHISLTTPLKSVLERIAETP